MHQCDQKIVDRLISSCTRLEVSQIFAYFGTFSLHQMTPLHLVVESNHITMVKWFLYQGADVNLQDDNEVILHTNAVNSFS